MEAPKFRPKEKTRYGNSLERVKTPDVEGLATSEKQLEELSAALRSIGSPNVEDSVKKNP